MNESVPRSSGFEIMHFEEENISGKLEEGMLKKRKMSDSLEQKQARWDRAYSLIHSFISQS